MYNPDIRNIILIIWPIERLKRIKPICESGSLVNSIKNLNIEYKIKNNEEINPVLFGCRL